jgi:hypothetical protein
MEEDILQDRLIPSVECVLAVYEDSRFEQAADEVLLLQQAAPSLEHWFYVHRIHWVPVPPVQPLTLQCPNITRYQLRITLCPYPKMQ